MKYLNTREAFLQTINETFQNEITWGGSLLGRLISSIIRKAKIEVNHQKVQSIATSIKAELDGLIANGLSRENQELIAKVTSRVLLEEIYNVVISDLTDKEKAYQLLDNDNKEGLITSAIKFLEVLPEGTSLGKGTKETLIEKLNKFKDLLEELNLEELTEEEKNDLEEKEDEKNNTEDNKEETDIKKDEEGQEEQENKEGDNGLEETNPEEDLFKTTYDLLESIINMNDVISQQKNIGTKKNPGLSGNTGTPVGETPAPHNNLNNNNDISKVKQKQNTNNNTQQLTSGAKQLTSGAKQLPNGTREIQGARENLMSFWDFFNKINERGEAIEGPKPKVIGGPKTKGNLNEPGWQVIDKGGKKDNTKKPTGDYIDYTMVGDEQETGNEPEINSNLWNKILNVWKKSGISEHIPMIVRLVKKAKEDDNSIEKKWIGRIGKQLRVNGLTVGSNAHDKLLSEAASDVISTAIPKSISLLGNAFFALKDKDNKLNKFDEYLKIFNHNYGIIVKPQIKSSKNHPKNTDDDTDNTNHKQISSPRNEEPVNNNRVVSKLERRILNRFFNLIREADETALANQDNTNKEIEPSNDLEETNGNDQNINDQNVDDNQNGENKQIQGEKEHNETKVKESWDQVFDENEENEWKLSQQEAEESKKQLETAKFQINLVDENNKDRLIKIANLFGKAYRLYTHSRIPSNRPGGRVSNITFREYIHLGNGTPGSPDDPGAGPWASKRVFNKFVDHISDYIENNDYKKIFNYGTIRRSDGKKILKGNILLEFIRDMIDETALKSYDKRRSEFLNKYFGLEGYVDKDSGKDYTNSNNTVKHIDESIKWEEINKITEGSQLKLGSFIALNVNFKFKNEGKASELKSFSKVIIGQIIKIQNNKILLKWQYNNESIPVSYAGAVLSKGHKYVGTSGPKDDINIGLIDLDRQQTTKIESSGKNNSTKGIIPNHNFLMIYEDINKPGKQHYTHYIPTKKELEKDVVRAGSLKNPISILMKSDKENNKEVITGEINKINTNILEKDKTIDIDVVFDSLEQYLNTFNE